MIYLAWISPIVPIFRPVVICPANIAIGLIHTLVRSVFQDVIRAENSWQGPVPRAMPVGINSEGATMETV